MQKIAFELQRVSSIDRVMYTFSQVFCTVYFCTSVTEGLYGDYRMIRNPEWEKGLDTGLSCVYVGEKPEYNPDDFVPGPVKKGNSRTSSS